MPVLLIWVIIPFVAITFEQPSQNYEPDKQDPFMNVLGITNIAALGALAYFGIRNHRRFAGVNARDAKLATFAEEHHYTYSPQASKTLRSPNFRLINQRDFTLKNGLSGDDWQYGELAYKTYRRLKSGEYHASTVYYSIFELKLDRSLPNMFFDGTKSHGQQYRWLVDDDQITSLEGDFDDHFITYFPEGYHIDARSSISPEVMTAMIDLGPCDIELYRDKLYIYSGLRPIASLPNALISHGCRW